jgi:hypothetical protein
MTIGTHLLAQRHMVYRARVNHFLSRIFIPSAAIALIIAGCSEDPVPEKPIALGDPCTQDADCPDGFNVFCTDTGDGECGPVVKRCMSMAATCGENPMTTTCGCDGKTFAAGPCGGAMPVNVDLRPGACPAAAGTFWCGTAACNAGTQYCVEGYTSIDCLDLPAACATPNANCACLNAQNMSACGCVDEPGGGIRVNGCGI